MTNPFRFLPAAIILLLLQACATRQTSVEQPLPELEPINIPEQERDPEAERQFWEAIAGSRVIYVAERHDDDANHEYQFDLIRSMRSRGMPFALGWEMFEISDEPLIRQWQQHRINTDDFLKQINWQKSWGTYSSMYEQMLRWALSAKIECIALNAPREMSRKIVQGQPFTDEERSILPASFEPPPDGYEHFIEQMAAHPGAKGHDLRPYYEAQQLWEQTMAERICRFLEANPNRKLVVFLGRGHASDSYGVPYYVRQRGRPKQVILAPGDPLDGRRLNLASGTICDLPVLPRES